MRASLAGLVFLISLAVGSGGAFGDAPATQPGQRIQQRIQIQVQGGDGGQVIVADGVAVGGAQGGVSVSTSRGPDKTEIKVSEDGKGSLVFVETADGKHLKIADADGKNLFDGDVNTAEQRKKVSDDAKALFLQLKRHVGIMGRRAVIGVAAGNGVIQPQAQPADNPLDGVFPEDGGYELSRLVGEHSVKVTIKGDKHRLLVRLKDKELFDGPIDTEEQWKAVKDVPADVLAEARKMDKNLSAEVAESSREKPTTRPERN